MVGRVLLSCGLLLGGPLRVWASGPTMCGESGTAVAMTMATTRSVRSRLEDPRLGELLRDGVAGSETLRRLVVALDASDVIVYVSFANNPKVRSYLAHDLVAAASFRYLHVVIGATLTDREGIAALAHELQHAMEVAQSPEVTDSAGITSLFRRIGYPTLKGAEVRETDAALRVQQRVKAELASPGGCRQ